MLSIYLICLPYGIRLIIIIQYILALYTYVKILLSGYCGYVT